jgi:hypothetical protein
MTRIQILTAVFAAVPGIIAVAPKASADQWDKKTTVTIGEPISVPGTTLEPGTYVFKLADSASDRHIVMIQNERQNRTFATILAINGQDCISLLGNPRRSAKGSSRLVLSRR